MKRFIWYWLPVLAWAGMIFYSSSQPYQKQDMRPTITQYVSPDLVERLFSWVKFNYANYEISIAHMGASGFLEFFLRKGAHFSVFFILGVLLCRAFSQYRLPLRQVGLYAFVLLATYAALDEVHQSFTGDRTPLWQDSALDSVGGLTGILVWSLFKRRRK
ncbi:VanZ family protein [Ectobacillus panaciterrae]|uniref:VanZ family protein n=1 Tax=Ectobacillus panaciterrae TaxID=363872 RepID=UPI00048E0394|nr:VanZ family protein [Ectobacillus panaciterrae]